MEYNSRSLTSDPSGGEFAGQELYWQGFVRGPGVVVDDPVPDLSSAGQESSIYRTSMGQSIQRRTSDRYAYIVPSILKSVKGRPLFRSRPPIVVGEEQVLPVDASDELA